MKNKGLVIIGLVFIIACTEKAPTSVNNDCDIQLEFTKSELIACKNTCNVSDPGSGGTVNPEPEPTPEPTEPEYEEYEAYKVSSAICKQADVSSCGITFSDCDDDTEYHCMTNFKYKRVKGRYRKD